MRRYILLVGSLLALLIFVGPIHANAATTHKTAAWGHRCTEYTDAAHTNEDTLAAMQYDVKHKIAMCESDVWRTKDNHEIIIHDQYPQRTITPASIKAAGVTAKTPWIDMTYAQVAKLRTKGGQTVPSLTSWIQHAIKWHQHVLIEIKWDVYDPAHFRAVAGAGVGYIAFYGTPHAGSCDLSPMDRMRAVGFVTGIKGETACPVTPAQMKQHRFTIFAGGQSQLTAAYVKAMQAVGVRVGNKDTQSHAEWKVDKARHVDFIIAPHPAALKAYLAG